MKPNKQSRRVSFLEDVGKSIISHKGNRQSLNRNSEDDGPDDLDISEPKIFRLNESSKELMSTLTIDACDKEITDEEYEFALDDIAEKSKSSLALDSSNSPTEASDVKIFNNTMNDLFVSFASAHRRPQVHKEPTNTWKIISISLCSLIVIAAIVGGSIAITSTMNKQAALWKSHGTSNKNDPHSSRHSMLFEPDRIRYSIPILLDFSHNKYASMQQQQQRNISSILSECLHLKGATIGKFLYGYYQLNENQDIDFLTATSLCDVPSSFKSNHRFRFFYVLQNPIISLVEESYNNNDERLIEEESIQNNNNNNALEMTNNVLIRSIVCKKRSNEVVSSTDLEDAKRILNYTNSYVVLMSHDMDAINVFQKKFHWKAEVSSSHNENNKCMESHFKNIDIQQASLLRDHYETNNLKQLYRLNSYDLNLYMGYVNASKRQS